MNWPKPLNSRGTWTFWNCFFSYDETFTQIARLWSVRISLGPPLYALRLNQPCIFYMERATFAYSLLQLLPIYGHRPVNAFSFTACWSAQTQIKTLLEVAKWEDFHRFDVYPHWVRKLDFKLNCNQLVDIPAGLTSWYSNTIVPVTPCPRPSRNWRSSSNANIKYILAFQEFIWRFLLLSVMWTSRIYQKTI